MTTILTTRDEINITFQTDLFFFPLVFVVCYFESQKLLTERLKEMTKYTCMMSSTRLSITYDVDFHILGFVGGFKCSM